MGIFYTIAVKIEGQIKPDDLGEVALKELGNLTNDNLVDVEMKSDCNARDIKNLDKKLNYI